MKYEIEVNTVKEGQTILRTRTELRGPGGVLLGISEGKAQSVAKSVGVALEGAWDALVPAVVVETRRALSGAKPEPDPVETAFGPLPDEAEGPLFRDIAPIRE